MLHLISRESPGFCFLSEPDNECSTLVKFTFCPDRSSQHLHLGLNQEKTYTFGILVLVKRFVETE